MSHLHGNVSSMATIASFGTQESEAARVGALTEDHRQSFDDAARLGATYVPTLQMIVGAGFVTTLVWGGAQVTAGAMSPGAFNVLGFSDLRLLAALGRMGVFLDDYQRTQAALRRIFDVLDMQPSIVSGDRALPAAEVKGDVRLDHVDFRYESDRKVFTGLSLHFPAGKTVGLVGVSGAGKSTVLKLIQRLYDASGGAVRIDGVDVRDFRTEDLRRAIAVVPQEISMFAGTIRDNIAYGAIDAPLEDVVAAAQAAEAHDFIMGLPDGYETRVGFGGHSLSVGQRQRIAIARVVLANRPILLFDEATSALDHETEASVQRSLRSITAGRTTIMVAHRLSTIRHADRIYVLDEGEIRESGRHDELIAADGIYASLWRVQTGEAISSRKARP
jgi:ATP-binding cassette subfamily B protein